MRRTPISRSTLLKRTPGPLRRTPIKPVSAKKRELDQNVRSELRGLVLHRAGSRCAFAETRRLGGCGGPLDVHEIHPRSADPSAPYIERNCRVLCRRHHELLTADTLLAQCVGMYIPRLENPYEYLAEACNLHLSFMRGRGAQPSWMAPDKYTIVVKRYPDAALWDDADEEWFDGA